MTDPYPSTTTIANLLLLYLSAAETSTMPDAMMAVADVLALPAADRVRTYADYPLTGNSHQPVWKSKVDQAKKALQSAGLVLRHGEPGYEVNRWQLSSAGLAAAQIAATEDPRTAAVTRALALSDPESSSGADASDEAVPDETLSAASKAVVTTIRFVRDSAAAREVKRRAGYRCLICQAAGIPLPNGGLYAEAHHVLPLRDGGPDHPSNMVCVCPSCHAALDYHAVPISHEAAIRSTSTLDLSLVRRHNERVAAIHS